MILVAASSRTAHGNVLPGSSDHQTDSLATGPRGEQPPPNSRDKQHAGLRLADIDRVRCRRWVPVRRSCQL